MLKGMNGCCNDYAVMKFTGNHGATKTQSFTKSISVIPRELRVAVVKKTNGDATLNASTAYYLFILTFAIH